MVKNKSPVKIDKVLKEKKLCTICKYTEEELINAVNTIKNK